MADAKVDDVVMGRGEFVVRDAVSIDLYHNPEADLKQTSGQ